MPPSTLSVSTAAPDDDEDEPEPVTPRTSDSAFASSSLA